MPFNKRGSSIVWEWELNKDNMQSAVAIYKTWGLPVSALLNSSFPRINYNRIMNLQSKYLIYSLLIIGQRQIYNSIDDVYYIVTSF